MKDKKIMKIVKQKADEKNIPDVSMLIKEKLNINQQVKDEQVVVQRRFNFKALYASMSLVLTASIIFVAVLIGQTDQSNIFDDTTFSDQAILTAISTVELIASDQVLDVQTSEMMLLSMETEDDYVENQIDEVLKYSEFMETLLNNPDQYERTLEKVSSLGYRYKLTYTFNDMTGEKTTYEFYYNQDITKKTNQYEIQGELFVGDQTFDLRIEGHLDEEAFDVIYEKDASTKLVSRFQKVNDMSQLSFKAYQNNELTSESQIAFNNKEEATLTFIKGEAKGIYRFSMDNTLPNGKIMRINYQIDDIDQGEIDLSVDDQEQGSYQINIRPVGRPQTDIQKDRPTMPGRPNHGNRPGN